MSTAAKMIQGTPVLGKMFKVNGNDDLASINAWPVSYTHLTLSTILLV